MCDSYIRLLGREIHRDKEQNGGCQHPGGERNRDLLFNGFGVSIQEDEDVVKANGGGGCATLNVLNSTELHARKWLKR